VQGCWIEGERPNTKAELLQAIRDGRRIEIEDLQFFGSEYSGPLNRMPEGAMCGIVGPDPFVAREWYATLRKTKGKVVMT
jgi:hypothetical protein